jgi:hypothetical protein
MLLSFRDRTPSALTAGPSSSLATAVSLDNKHLYLKVTSDLKQKKKNTRLVKRRTRQGCFSVLRICSHTRDQPACVKFHAADNTQLEFQFSTGSVI